MTSEGEIPVKVLLRVLAIVTAGFEKEVDEVNQYAAPIYIPTAAATNSTFCFPTNKIVFKSPNVAIISEIKTPLVSLIFSDIDIILKPKMILATITPVRPPST